MPPQSRCTATSSVASTHLRVARCGWRWFGAFWAATDSTWVPNRFATPRSRRRIVPFVRELAGRGTRIVLAANEGPALNDITIAETRALLAQLGRIDDQLGGQLADGQIRAVSSGGRIPMIDLADVPDELNEAARGADLVILEGMGRAVESNYDAELVVDTLRLALLKDEEVAARIGGRLYDCVCKYTPLRGDPPTPLRGECQGGV